MKDKALLVLDQVSWRALDGEVRARGLSGAHKVRLDYVPRTTPVGHATISTGQVPAAHRVQGRRWHEDTIGVGSWARHDIDDIITLTPPPVFDAFVKHSLARRLRQEQYRAIVAVAAKAFIPFLLGAWDCDVFVYPLDVAPSRIASGPNAGLIGLRVVFVAMTQAGASALVAAWSNIAMLLRTLTHGAGTIATPTIHAGSPAAHHIEWLMPTAWGTQPASYLPQWRRTVARLAVAIDDMYTDVAREILGHMAGPRALLQSRFSTDAYGHKPGPSSADYARALTRGVDCALALQRAGYTVGVTSDHGGRDTPGSWKYDATGSAVWLTTTVSEALPSTLIHFTSGDHVIGYGGGGPTGAYTVGPGTLPTVTWPATVVARSFAPRQVPDWIVMGDKQTRIADGRFTSGGGDHGACTDGVTIADIDNEVPAWSPSTTGKLPSTHEQVAGWFLGL